MYCFFCKKNNFQLIYKLKTKIILRCKSDGLFLAQETKNDEQKYGQKYFSHNPHLSNRSYFLKKIRKIQELTSMQKPKILDIGCGWGNFEQVLEKEKISYLGIDTSKEAMGICKKKGLNCIKITLDKLIQTVEDGRWKMDFEDRKLKVDKFHPLPSNFKHPPSTLNHLPSKLFDAITLFQVIEHFKNPLALLKSAKKLLKKNGLILITTPNNDSPLRKFFGSRWSVYNEPSHSIFYNKKTLRETLNSAGFKNIQVSNDSLRFLSLTYIVKRLNEMFFHSESLTLNSKFLSIPIPTDPLGDLEAIGFK